LGGAAGGIEVGEEAVETGEGKLGVEAEVAVGFGDWMFVGEVAVVVANDEEVEELFVNFLEAFDAFVGFGVGDVEAERSGLCSLGGFGEDFDVEAVFEGVGETGDEVHAAAWTAAWEFGVDLGIHGAGEVRDGLRGEEGEEGTAAHRGIIACWLEGAEFEGEADLFEDSRAGSLVGALGVDGVLDGRLRSSRLADGEG